MTSKKANERTKDDIIETPSGKICKICRTPVRYNPNARAFFHTVPNYPRDIERGFATLAREVTDSE